MADEVDNQPTQLQQTQEGNGSGADQAISTASQRDVRAILLQRTGMTPRGLSALTVPKVL